MPTFSTSTTLSKTTIAGISFFFFCYKEVNDQTPYHIILDIFKIILKDKLVEEFHAYLWFYTWLIQLF